MVTLPDQTAALVAAVLFAGGLLRGAVGFGDAVLAMPVLVGLVGLRTATPVVGLAAVVAALTLTAGSWRQIDFGVARVLLVGAAVGVPVGVTLVGRMPEDVLTSGLGALMVVYGAYELLGPPLPRVTGRGWTAAAGITAGVLGGAYNVSGPAVVVHGNLRGDPPARFRATLQAFFVGSSILIAAGQGAGGLWGPPVLRLFALSLPAQLAGLGLGALLHGRLPPRRFRSVVGGLIIVMGVLLIG